MRKIKDIDWFTGLGNYILGFIMGGLTVVLLQLLK